MKNTGSKGIFQKTVAFILGITMALGALMLPNSGVTNGFLAASAYEYVADSCKYTFSTEYIEGEGYVAIIESVEASGDTVTVPKSLVVSGDIFPVREIGDGFFKDDDTIKTVIIPNGVKRIGNDAFRGSSVENITLPNSLEHLGDFFASDCQDLKSLKYDGTKIVPEEMGKHVFFRSKLKALENEKGAVCLGNWLMKLDYNVPGDTIVFSELGNNGTKIEYVGSSIFDFHCNAKTADLKGIKYVGSDSLGYCESLEKIINDDEVSNFKDNRINKTQWYEACRNNGIAKLGDTLLYYSTDKKEIDLTSDEMAKIKYVGPKSLVDCPNADTLRLNSSQELHFRYLKTEYRKLETEHGTKSIGYNNIKNIFIDGKELVYSENEPVIKGYLYDNFEALEYTECVKRLTAEKTQHLFKQLDIPYYGEYNNRIGTLSATDEFYTYLKIHDYISIYEFDKKNEYLNVDSAFLAAGKLNCQKYTWLTGYLLKSAGVGYLNLGNQESHEWTEVKIGGEWFECDEGWDAQLRHIYSWFGLSSSRVLAKDSRDHVWAATYDDDLRIDRIEAKRVIGDINGDDLRDEDDLNKLWSYLKARDDIKSMINIDKKAADINFDGTIDVTDGVLLENFVNGTALDVNNIPKDGLAPGFKVAFLEGTNNNHIQYAYTDRDGYITLPDDVFEVPEGMKLKGYNIGKAGERVKIHNPYTVISPVWVDINEPDESSLPDSSTKPDSSSGLDDSSKPDIIQGKLGDVNNDGTIDIEDAVSVIQHINGLTPLNADEKKRADVSKDNKIEIDDAVMIISRINGNITF